MRLNICQWNMGTNVNDYGSLIGPHFYSLSNEEMEPYEQKRNQAAERIVAYLADAKVDIFCLQEMNETTRPEIQKLKKAGYEIFQCSAKSKFIDTAIAISNSFVNVENRSFRFSDGYDVTSVVASTKSFFGRKRVGVLSAHFTGFNLEAKSSQEMENESHSGDLECRELAERVVQAYKDCDIVVLGGDFNAWRGIYPKRFEILEQAGLQVYSTHQPTNKTTHPRIAKHFFERELDHFAVYAPAKKFLWWSERFMPKVEVSAMNKEDGFDPDKNTSDHLPIFLKING